MKKFSLPAFLTVIVFCAINIPNAEAYNAEGYKKFIHYVQSIARSKGVRETTLHEAFRNAKFNYKVVVLDTKQPERSKGPGFQKYKDRVVSVKRINAAKQKLYENRQLLADLERTYGVDKEILVALWGVETNFGVIMGDFNIINSLSSLAYEGRRRQFFTDELIKALKILDNGHVSMKGFKSSWAGAFGQVQFMPSTFDKYAVDYDKDGRKDLWHNNGDALASAANYLYSIGWQPNIGWGKRVIIPVNLKQVYIGKHFSQPMYKWAQMGLRYADGSQISNASYNGTLIDADGDYGSRKELYLVTDNYKKIMEWNRSTYFAVSIGLIADAIKY